MNMSPFIPYDMQMQHDSWMVWI